MKINVPIVNPFVDGNDGGNPAGIVLDAQKYMKTCRSQVQQQILASRPNF